MSAKLSERNVHSQANRIFVIAGLASLALLCPRTTTAQSKSAQTGAAAPLAASFAAKPAPPKTAELRARLAANYGRLPLAFEANVGQTDAQVKFLSHGAGFTLFLTPEEAVLTLVSQSNTDRKIAATTPIQSPVLRMKLAGANANPQILGLDELRGKSNYILGSDPKKWHTGVQNFARVEYRNIYPGVNLVYYGHEGRLEDDFEIEPDASPRAIRLKITGATKIALDRAGNAVLSVRDGKVVLEKPGIYQQLGALRHKVSGHYVIEGRNELAFAVGAYDHSQRVVIDPTLVYSTYLGGNSSDQAQAVAVDANGGAYLTGQTGSSNFPVSIPPSPTAYQTTCPSSCDVAFVTKIDTTQSGNNSLVYSTYLGPVSNPTSTFTVGNSIAVDSSGEAVVVGDTDSTFFPIFPSVGAVVDGTPSGAFVFKLSADGSAPIFSTYLGGTGTDLAFGVALDHASPQNIYVVGNTSSPNLATSGVFSQGASLNSGSFAGFVTKLNSTASSFIFYAYLNGGDARAVATDSSGDAYVVGDASSAAFPTTSNAYQTSFTGAANSTLDAFFSVISSSGTSLQYSTFLAGSGFGSAIGTGVAVDGSGNAYITGSSGGAVSLTGGTEFPTTSNAIGAGTAACGTPTATFIPCPLMFVANINPNLSGKASLVNSTYLGGIYPNVGPFGDSANAIALDSAGDAFITGNTSSTDFPLPNVALGPNPIQSQPPCPAAGLSSCFATTAFLVELSPDLSSITYSTYLGNPSSFNSSGQATFSPFMHGFGIAVDGSGNAYIAGDSNPGSLQTTSNAFQPSSPTEAVDANSGFLIEIGTSTPSADLGVFGSASPSPAPVNSTLTYTLTVTNSGPSGATGVTLTDTLPGEISFQSATSSTGGSCTNASGIVNCSLGSLANGAAATVTITVSTPSTASILNNSAIVSANESDPYHLNNTAVTTVDVIAQASVPPQIVKTFGVSSIPLDGVTSLTFSISNPNSGSSLSGISFTDSFPAGLAVAGINNLTNNGCGGTLTGAAGTSSVSLAGGTLAGGASCSVSLNVTGTAAGTINNSVTVSSTQAGAGNTSTASLVVQAGLFSPTSGTQGQTLNVSFTGSGFIAGVTTVQFGSSTSGITVNSVTVTDPGDLVANITIGSTAKSGAVNVSVTTGTKRSSYGTFRINPPALSVSPNIGTQGETLDVTLTGLTFVSGMTVQFGSSTSGITVNSLTVPNATEAIANISIALNAPTKSVNVTVTNGQALFNEGNAFTVGPAALTLSPNIGTQGATLDVTLTGLTFVSGMTVQFGSSTSGITVNSLNILSASETIANVSIALNAPQKSVYVTVTNGLASFREGDAFTVGPAALTLSPNTGTQGATLDVTLTGLTFVPGMTVQFGSSTSGVTVNSLNILNASEATTNVSIALNAPTRSLFVTVTNGQSTFSENKAFTVGPAALTLSPNTGTQGETLDVTLTGLTFVNGMTVQFGSSTSGITVNSFNILSASEATANISIAWNAPTKSVNVSVTNGQALFNEGNAFTVGPAALTLSPNTGEIGQTLNVVMSGLPFESGPAEFAFETSPKTRTLPIKLNSLTPIDANNAIANITIKSSAMPATYTVSVFFPGPPMLVFSNVGQFTIVAP